jgi:hypothetical protein
MSSVILIKLSEPGWEKIFDSENQARNELYKWICNQCKEEEGIRANSPLDELLASACGCEFDVEYTDSSDEEK